MTSTAATRAKLYGEAATLDPKKALAAMEEARITVTGTIAHLPAGLLWAAAKVAGDDIEGRPLLCSVDVRHDAKNGAVRIASTNGTQAFRCMVKSSDQWFVSAEQNAPFRLNPIPFRKSPSLRTAAVRIDSSGLAYFLNKSGDVVSAVPWFPDERVAGTYPAIDKIWPPPNSLTCNAGGFIGIDGALLSDAAAIFARIATRGYMKIFTQDSPVRPVVLQSVVDPAWLLEENKGTKNFPSYKCDETIFEQIIMPVQYRS